MSRLKKLLAVGFILLMGVGLAWPFRKTEQTSLFQDIEHSQEQVSVRASFPDQSMPVDSGRDEPTRHVVAKMASTTDRLSVDADNSAVSHGASFDLANHPSVLAQSKEALASPVTPTAKLPSGTAGALSASLSGGAEVRSGLATSGRRMTIDGDNGMPVEILHIVRNSDTLEKLAERYLGDGGRALEIFDLNRNQLENPHLLPIGAELRIPVDATQTLD